MSSGPLIFEAWRRALAGLPTASHRAVLFKSLGWTIAGLVAVWFGMRAVFDAFALPFIDELLPGLPAWLGWLGAAASVVAAIGAAVALAFLLAPATALVAGLFIDDLADTIERDTYPRGARGQALSLGRSLVASLKFLVVVVLFNAAALVLLLVPGVNIVIFFVVNAYLLSREYFEFAAMRFLPKSEARALRRRHRGTVFAAGLAVAALLTIPLLNLLTPIFAAASMIHLARLIEELEREAPLPTS